VIVSGHLRRSAPLAAAIAAAVASAAIPVAASAQTAPLLPQPLRDLTPARGMSQVAFCEADLGAGDAVAWMGHWENSDASDVIEVLVGSVAAGAPARVEAAAGIGGCPSVSTSADGASLLAWKAGTSEEPTQISFVERPAAGPLGTALPIAGAVGSVVTAARAAGGAAVVGWLQYELVDDPDPDAFGSLQRVQPFVSVRDPGGAFGPPIALDLPADAWDAEGRGPSVGIDAAGNAIAVWRRPSGTESSDPDDLLVARRPAGGSFGAPVPIGTREPHGRVQLAVAPSGEALLVVDERSLHVASGNVRDGFGPPEPFAPESPPGSGAEATAAIVDGGGAAVAWVERDGDGRGLRVVVRSRPSGAAPFGPAHALATRSDGQSPPGTARLALAPDGRALVTWIGPGRGLPFSQPYVAVGHLASGWQPARPLAHGCRSTRSAQPAFGGDGSPRVSLLHTAVYGGGDIFFPWASRLRTVAFGTAAPETRPPRLRLTVPRLQPLPRSRRGREQEIRAVARCSEACDLLVTARSRHRELTDEEVLFPAWARLRAGERRVVRLHTTDAFDYGIGSTLRAGDVPPVAWTAHACDAAGNVATARASGRVVIPFDISSQEHFYE
jgi:hypothetical protein